MKGVQCCELFGGIPLKNHAFLPLFVTETWLGAQGDERKTA